jgi:hypothetical protein
MMICLLMVRKMEKKETEINLCCIRCKIPFQS